MYIMLNKLFGTDSRLVGQPAHAATAVSVLHVRGSLSPRGTQ